MVVVQCNCAIRKTEKYSPSLLFWFSTMTILVCLLLHFLDYCFFFNGCQHLSSLTFFADVREREQEQLNVKMQLLESFGEPCLSYCGLLVGVSGHGGVFVVFCLIVVREEVCCGYTCISQTWRTTCLSLIVVFTTKHLFLMVSCTSCGSGFGEKMTILA